MARWRTIKDFPNYQVSSDGRVRSIGRRVRNGKSSRWIKPSERVVQRRPKCGYCHLMLYRDNKGTNCYVHILVADTFIPNPENKPTVNHKDGNKTRNVVSNLEWSTWSENHMHKTRVLGRGRGSGHSHAKLTDNEVIFIRYDKRPRKVIARDFGVSISTVDSIVNRKTWKHLV